MTLKIVIDENIPLAEAFFSPLAEVVRMPGRTLSAADVRDADALIVRSVTPVNEALLAGSKVKFVGTCTIGTDHLDVAYFNQQGIAYSSAPGCNANSVVEYIFSALSALNVDWRGKSVGIVGCGNVGGHLHRRLLALGVDCRCYDPFLSHADNADLCSLDEVLASNIVCLHTPLTLSGPHPTRHLIGMAQLQQLTSGALLLNAGRGDVIDNNALLNFMQQRKDVQVVLDVWEGEPNINTSLLRLVDLATPHIAGYSFDGKVAGTEMIFQAFCSHFGIDATICAADLVAADLTPLELSVSTDFELMRQAVLAAYDIRCDDARMREQLQNLPAHELRQGFDTLRKNYPKRREFHCFCTQLIPHIEKKSLNNMLATLGFCTGFETSKTGVNT